MGVEVLQNECDWVISSGFDLGFDVQCNNNIMIAPKKQEEIVDRDRGDSGDSGSSLVLENHSPELCQSMVITLTSQL